MTSQRSACAMPATAFLKGTAFRVFIFVIITITEPVLNPNQMFEDDIQRGLIVVLRCNNDGLSYHSGTNELFFRHLDTDMNLTASAPTLAPQLFDGLNWRSRLKHDGLRRANHIRPLLITLDGKFAATTKCLCNLADPGNGRRERSVSPIFRTRNRIGVTP